MLVKKIDKIVNIEKTLGIGVKNTTKTSKKFEFGPQLARRDPKLQELRKAKRIPQKSEIEEAIFYT